MMTMDSGIKQILDELLRINKETLIKENADETGAAVLKLVAMQVADSLNDLKRIADALEKISNLEFTAERIGPIARIFMGETPEPVDTELEAKRKVFPYLHIVVQFEDGKKTCMAEWVRKDDKIIAVPTPIEGYTFELDTNGLWLAHRV